VFVAEATHRSVRALLLVCLVPIAVLFITPRIRPIRWWRILYTYLVPIIPLAIWWDGVVSCLRTYAPHELLELAVAGDDGSALKWTAFYQQGQGQPLPVTVLIGTR
jgi:hypothetical protein